MANLYRLDFSSGKSYVGVTQKTSQQRYEGHASSAAKGSEYLVHCAWRKFGAPKLTLLAVVENRVLEETERRAVEVFDTLVPNGYNMIPGGALAPSYARIGRKHSEYARKRMSETHRRRLADPKERMKLSVWRKRFMASPEGLEFRFRLAESTRRRMLGSSNPNCTPEARARMSERERGKPHPWQLGANNVAHRPEVIAKKSGENSPTKRPEVRLKISTALKAYYAALETRPPGPNKGKKMSLEARAKMSAAKLGKKQSPEHIARRTAWRKTPPLRSSSDVLTTPN